MQCTDFETKLNDVIDQRRSPQSEPELRDHTRQCSSCAELASAYSRLQSAAAKVAQPELRPEFSLGVLRSLDQVHRRSRSRHRWVTIVLAVAAAILVGFVSWPRLPESASPVQPSPAAQPLVLSDQYDFFVRETDTTVRKMEWVGEVAEGFRPVTQSFYSALNALRRTLLGQTGEREHSSQAFRLFPVVA